MAFKFVILACVVSVAFAGLLPTYGPPKQNYLPPQPSYLPPQPSTQAPPVWKPAQQPEAPANYEFQYAVNEPSTGDIKEQHEKAENGVIKGQYWLIEPDGSKRIVDYTADDKNGFQATVKIIPAEAGWQQPQQKPVSPPKPNHGNDGYYY